MKARIINTPVEVEVQAYFTEGLFAGFTDVSGGLQPGMVVYRPSDLEFIDRPAPLEPIVDWSAFRREVAKYILSSLCSFPPINYKEDVQQAINIADELIRQLKEEQK